MSSWPLESRNAAVKFELKTFTKWFSSREGQTAVAKQDCGWESPEKAGPLSVFGFNTLFDTNVLYYKIESFRASCFHDVGG